MSETKSTRSHRWSFFRAGGVDQVRLDSGADMLQIGDLDQKLWVALSCPVKGLEFDERTLALLDSDKDNRVRAPEIIAAVQWIKTVLKRPDELARGAAELPLDAIDESTTEGKRILASARHILASLGKAKNVSITVADAMDTAQIFAKAKLNGDGIVPPESIDDAGARATAADIIACLGGEKDRSGTLGVSQSLVAKFFAELSAYSDWWQKGEVQAKSVMPLGGATGAASAALQAVRPKIDDYFGRCRLAAFDPRAQAVLNREEQAYLEFAGKDMSITAQEVAGFPLAQVAPKRPLPLIDGVNPAWASAIAQFRTAAVGPAIGNERTSLSEEDWIALCTRLADYETWQAAKAGAAVEKLGIKRVRETLASKSQELLTKAIAADLAVAPEVDAMTGVERLTRYYRDLHQLLNNFVSFTDFYSRRRKAVFLAGTLYLDGRSCDLCVRVDDPAKHAALAGLAKTFLAYVECTRPSSGEKMTIAAAFTAGDSDHLMVGRNGIFYDRKGRDWDATITKMIENPISIPQAFWSPYKRLMRWIEEQIAKRAAAADEGATAKLTSAATAAGAATTGAAPAPKPKFDVGVVAALGVAVGGITAALSGLLGAFFGLGMWMPIGFVALILLISGPAMVIAWLKLRQRNLGPILDANGWAVNGRVKVNIPLGAVLTQTATLPAGSQRSLTDPYAPKKSIWPKLILVFLLLGLVGWGLHSTGQLEKIYEQVSGKPYPFKKAEEPATTKPEDKPATGEAEKKVEEPAKK
ncbi:MAG: hypothetical protein ACKVX7_11215 [Planctomycetota bacterium]